MAMLDMVSGRHCFAVTLCLLVGISDAFLPSEDCACESRIQELEERLDTMMGYIEELRGYGADLDNRTDVVEKKLENVNVVEYDDEDGETHSFLDFHNVEVLFTSTGFYSDEGADDPIMAISPSSGSDYGNGGIYFGADSVTFDHSNCYIGNSIGNYADEGGDDVTDYCGTHHVFAYDSPDYPYLPEYSVTTFDKDSFYISEVDYWDHSIVEHTSLDLYEILNSVTAIIDFGLLELLYIPIQAFVEGEVVVEGTTYSIESFEDWHGLLLEFGLGPEIFADLFVFLISALDLWQYAALLVPLGIQAGDDSLSDAVPSNFTSIEDLDEYTSGAQLLAAQLFYTFADCEGEGVTTICDSFSTGDYTFKKDGSTESEVEKMAGVFHKKDSGHQKPKKKLPVPESTKSPVNPSMENLVNKFLEAMQAAGAKASRAAGAKASRAAGAKASRPAGAKASRPADPFGPTRKSFSKFSHRKFSKPA